MPLLQGERTYRFSGKIDRDGSAEDCPSETTLDFPSPDNLYLPGFESDGCRFRRRDDGARTSLVTACTARGDEENPGSQGLSVENRLALDGAMAGCRAALLSHEKEGHRCLHVGEVCDVGEAFLGELEPEYKEGWATRRAFPTKPSGFAWGISREEFKKICEGELGGVAVLGETSTCTAPKATPLPEHVVAADFCEGKLCTVKLLFEGSDEVFWKVGETLARRYGVPKEQPVAAAAPGYVCPEGNPPRMFWFWNARYYDTDFGTALLIKGCTKSTRVTMLMYQNQAGTLRDLRDYRDVQERY